MEKRIQNIKFNFQGKGKLEKAFETPVGNIWVHQDQRVWYFDGEEEDLELLELMTTIYAELPGMEKARVIVVIINTFYRVTKVTTLGDSVFFEISTIKGELEPIVESSLGILYANREHQFWYFKPNKDFPQKIGNNFQMFVAITREEAKKKEEARYVLQLLRTFYRLGSHCIREEAECYDCDRENS